MRHALSAALLGLTLLAAHPAAADTSHIALHATEGSTTVTVLTAPDPLVPGPVQVGVVVENAASASLAATLTQGSHTETAALTRMNGLYSGVLHAGAPGAYQLAILVHEANRPAAIFQTTVLVQPNEGRRLSLLLAALVPAVVIVLFLANQQLKSSRGGPGRDRGQFSG